MAKIKKITAREILSSRGIPTVETQLQTDSGIAAVSSVSAGDAGGISEKVELRDADHSRYDGLGVRRAVSYINTLIGPKLQGADLANQQDIDIWLNNADKSENKHILGVNTIMCLSQVVAKAASIQTNIPLYQYFNNLLAKKAQSKTTIDRVPPPVFTMINGGSHGIGTISFQEFGIVPSTSMPFDQALQAGVKIYNGLETVLQTKNIYPSLSKEGAYAPILYSNIAVLDIILEALASEKEHVNTDISLSLDIAASNFYSGLRYKIEDRPTPLKPDEYLDFIYEINKQYRILLLEDPLEKNDLSRWEHLVSKYGSQTYIIGDDFISGNKQRLAKAISGKSCHGVIIKSGQMATISEMIDFALLCKQNNLKIIVGQRLNETNDPIMADFAVGIAADFVKFGPPVSGERVLKYNRLLQIQQNLIDN